MKLGDSAAYPSDFDSNCAPEFGMSLRQYYAGLAMHANRSNPEYSSANSETMAKYAVEDADALLKELEK